MRVGILPYELRYQHDLAKVSVNSLAWPGQDLPSVETLGDLNEDDHVVVYPSSKRLLRGFGKVRCKVDLILAEPLAIHKRYYQSIWLLRHKFNTIYCRYGYYSKRYKNVVKFAVVDSWVDGNLVDSTLIKTKSCSIIASGKKDLKGHKLRHQIIAWVKKSGVDVDALGRGFKSFEFKQEGLLPYRHSVVIENVQEPDYFTEKLLDCMLCGTMPIYWGAPNISEYFDPVGMHICLTYDDLVDAIELIDSAQQFSPTSKQRTAMDANRKCALNLSHLKLRIVDAVYTHGS